jgi:hypothetical protein
VRGVSGHGWRGDCVMGSPTHSFCHRAEGNKTVLISISKSRKMRWAGHIARMGPKRNGRRILVGKPERKRQLGRPRRRWEDNVRMDLREI